MYSRKSMWKMWKSRVIHFHHSQACSMSETPAYLIAYFCGFPQILNQMYVNSHSQNKSLISEAICGLVFPYFKGLNSI